MTPFLLVLNFLACLAVRGGAQVASPAIPPDVLKEQVGLSENASPCEKAVSIIPAQKIAEC
jgi:hypothetical protein